MNQLNLLLVEELSPGGALPHKSCEAILGPVFRVRRVTHLDAALALLEVEAFDAVLLDAGSSRAEVLTALEIAREPLAAETVILLSNGYDEALAALAERGAMSFYLVKDATLPRMLALVIRSVTGRKRAEEALKNARHENHWLSTAIDSVTVGVVIVDPRLPDAPITFVNPVFCEITGYSRPEILGRNCRFLQGPETDRDMVAQIRAALAERRPFRGTLRNYRKDGSAFWNLLSIAPTFDKTGELLGFVGVQQDVTAQVQEKERLQRSEASLALSQRVAQLGSWELELDDGEGGAETVYWSDETFRIFGYEPGAVTPTRASYRSMVHPDDREEMESRFARTLHVGEAYSMDQRLVRPDGTERCVHLEAKRLPGSGGRARWRIAGTVQDITERKRAEEALHKSEERLQIIIENLTEGLIVSDIDGNLLHWNQASLQMHGFTDPEQGHGALAEFGNLFELRSLDGSLLTLDQWPLPRIIRGERLVDFEVLIRKIGTDWERVFSYGGAIVHESDGRPVAFVTVNDITERKKADLVATRLAAIVESSADAIIGKTLEGRITSWNRGAAALYGYTAEEAIGRSINFLVPPEGLEDERMLLEKIRRGERLQHFETLRIRKDGSPVDVSMSVSPVRDHSGRVVAVSAISRDITEQKQAEAALRASELRYQRIVLNVPGMVYQAVRHADGSFEFPFVSEGCREIFGVEPEQIQNDPSLAIRAFHPEDRESYERSVAESAATLQPWKWEGRFVLSSGVVKWMQGAARPARLGNGDTLWEGVFVDITERKRADELRGAKEEAERANIAKSEFLSRMSHELRTPLNAIIGFGQILEISPVAKGEQESIDLILKAGRHLLKLIDEVLDIARIESGRLEMSPEPVAIHPLLQEVFTMIRPLASQRGIELLAPAVDSPGIEGEAHVAADRQRLRQVLLNLLANAVKYNVTCGKVSLDCVSAPAAGRVRIRVTDTGLGIPMEKRALLFKPFERLGAEFSRVEGSGLGLALSKRLVEAMGGEIGLEDNRISGINQGTIFWVELPLAASPLEVAVASETSARGNLPKPPPLPQDRTLLYIEDNLSNLKLIERLLRDYPEVRLLTAMQATLGLELAQQFQPDLILLDVHLPDLPGWEVLARLRANPSTASLPVIVLSADATDRQRERLLAAGAQAYLTKPIDVHRFLQILRHTLASSAKRTPFAA